MILVIFLFIYFFLIFYLFIYFFFFFFLSISHPDASYHVSSKLTFNSGEETKIDFQDGVHLGYPIGKF